MILFMANYGLETYCLFIYSHHVVGAQLCLLSSVDAQTVALKQVYGKIARHYSR